MKIDKRLGGIVMYAMVLNLIVFAIWGIGMQNDSNSYIIAWDESLSNGHLDIHRTVVYPLLIGFCKALFGHHFLLGVVIIQCLIHLISIVCLYELLLWQTSSKSLSFWLLILYVSFPAVLMWNTTVMTESLAISFGVFILWYLKRVITNCSWFDVIVFSFLLLTAVSKNRGKWVMALLDRFRRSFHEMHLGLSLYTVYVFLIVFAVVLINWVLKAKVFPWYAISLFGIGVSNILFAVTFAQNAWARLVVPSIPAYLMMLGILFKLFDSTSIESLKLS